MSYALVQHVALGSTTGDGVTTVGVDTTGAKLIVVGVSDFATASANAISDSKSNTWTALTTYAGASARVRQFYCINPTVGTGHTFTYNSVGSVPTVTMTAFSATNTPVLDGETGHTQASGTTNATGSITPSVANCVLIATLMANDSTSGAPVDSGFTISDQIDQVGGQHFEGAMAYLIETVATAKNPTWTTTDGNYSSAAVSVFKEATATAARLNTLMGVG